jgi:hypothetical protein
MSEVSEGSIFVTETVIWIITEKIPRRSGSEWPEKKGCHPEWTQWVKDLFS